ncbi:hypothetical protein [Hamadaea tsunoensis]|uniref:hypothetical protein n=1 Tax=Hamadaea tsunoensis TaxID=53368 RepID=UPI0004135B0B|nr:hypothetical protein [Hamadaea tsunoensis]
MTIGTPPVAPKKRDPLPFIIAGGVVAVLLSVCCIGGGIFVIQRQNDKDQGDVPSPRPSATGPGGLQPSAAPTGEVSSEEPLSGAACLVGTWRETSHTGSATINGVDVQLKTSGRIQRFTADGKITLDMGPTGSTQTGKANGDTYTVINKGKITWSYRTEPGIIFYADPKGSGTTTWKRNGHQIDSEPLRGSVGPEYFACNGDKLVENTQDYAIELTRVLG